MASSFSRPAGRKKSPQGATGPSTLNVPKEESNPRKRTFSRIQNSSKLPISRSKQETAGHSLPLTKFFICGKKISLDPFCSCDFLTDKQGNKPPMGKEFFGFEPDAFLKSAMPIQE
ncbi:hypothetical protein AVEN_224724-1 [Araneus ventricosus]|uniref:Uncharacterized protein n=1 Tax=Araneus ventricosus TaxID=182803 RepID=A0A4Y2S7K2_ARAVE|nr:hypothetical protein AVEN_224724-1 [Araneus ventricosus]